MATCVACQTIDLKADVHLVHGDAANTPVGSLPYYGVSFHRRCLPQSIRQHLDDASVPAAPRPVGEAT